MKHRWTTLLWELWAALALCAGAALWPGSDFCTYPGLVVPGLVLAAVVPVAWAVWGIRADPPPPLPQEQPLEPLRRYELEPLFVQTECCG